MKRLFVTILEGDSPQTARPLMASEDPAVVRAVALELHKRLATETSGTSKAEKPCRHLTVGRKSGINDALRREPEEVYA